MMVPDLILVFTGVVVGYILGFLPWSLRLKRDVAMVRERSDALRAEIVTLKARLETKLESYFSIAGSPTVHDPAHGPVTTTTTTSSSSESVQK